VKILYLAYAFAPTNIVSAQRAVFQAKYLAEAGAEVVVMCATQSGRREDPSLLSHLEGVRDLTIYQITPWRCCGLEFKPAGKGWLWLWRVQRQARRLLTSGRFDLIYSTYGPKYPHLAAAWLSHSRGVPWVAEYRDPWSGNANKRREAGYWQRRFERWLLRPALALVTVSEGFRETLRAVHGDERPIAIVYNGYEQSVDSGQLKAACTELATPPLRLVLAGTVYEAQFRGLDLLFAALAGRDDVVFEYFGSSWRWVQRLIETYQLERLAWAIPPVPHSEAVAKLRDCDVAVLPVSPVFKGQLPVKFYDYLAARRPVLMIGGEGSEIATIMMQTDSGRNAQSVPEIQSVLDALVRGSLTFSFRDQGRYSRRQQAGLLLAFLTDLLDQSPQLKEASASS
jgi:hypothetical protein